MSIRVNVTIRCDAPGCTRSLPSELELWSWPNGPASYDLNLQLAANGWGPGVVAGSPIGGTHLYCKEHWHHE